MKKANYQTIVVIISALLMCLAGCKKNNPGTTADHTFESDDQFYNNEILMPDYVHQDTLIVIDASLLNWSMGNYDIQSDGDIMDILRVTTKKF